MNKVQQRIFYAAARDKRILAPRRFGKTDGVLGPQCYAVASSMPRGAGIWLGASRKQLYSRTIPGAISAIKRMFGFTEGVHFGFGRPPKGIPDCIIKPKSFDDCLWFANGFLWHMISMAVPGAANGMTVNSIIADECKFISKSKLDEWIMPTLSGITHPQGDLRFSDQNPYYKSSCFVSDASLSTKGNWLEKEEEKLDQIITEGIFEGKSYREIEAELNAYADELIFYNELMRDAKKGGHRVPIVRTQAEKDYWQAEALAAMHHEGKYRILPGSSDLKEISPKMAIMLTNYGVTSAEDASMLRDHRFILTDEQRWRMFQIMRSKSYQEHVKELQRNSFYFVRASTLDNVDILRDSYIAKMKRDLPPLIFAVSILGLKQQKVADGFYFNLDIENLHGYLPETCPAIEGSMHLKRAYDTKGNSMGDYETPDFDALSDKNDCTTDGDIVDALPLEIGFDYNSNINWVVTGQTYGVNGRDTLSVLGSIFVKTPDMLEQLCEKWNKYYAPHRMHNKQVNFYYDAQAKFRAYALQNSKDFKDIVIGCLRKYGWDVNPIDMGKIYDQEGKYIEINQSLGGFASPMIRFNRENNEALIIAMENAGVSRGYNGFKKDKSGEKLDEDADDSIRAEYRTDGTDAFDELFLGVKHYRNVMSGMCLPMG